MFVGLRVAGVPKAEKIAVGTKFKWKKDDDNFRVAIQSKKGFLQVVEVMNGTYTLHEYKVRTMHLFLH